MKKNKVTIGILKDPNFTWQKIKNMERSRHNDGTYYCIPSIYWCNRTGSLLFESQALPYDEEYTYHLSCTNKGE